MNKARLFYWSFYLILFLASPDLKGQGPARLRCLEVLDNGDVLIHWEPEVFGTGAYSYTLHHSSAIAGPYTLLDSVTNLSQETLIHAGAGANLSPHHYYMFVYRTDGKSEPSDTLSSMVVTGTTTDFELISLSWTPLHLPLADYMHPWYLLFREYPPGAWQVVDSTAGLSMDYHFLECNAGDDTVKFKIGVRVDDALVDCHSFSNKTGYVLKNQTNRYPPVIDSVSIDASGNSVIGWQPAIEPDIKGYTIFRVSGSNDSIAYVEGRFNTSFTHLNSNPCDGPMSYIILSIDSCGNESPFPYDPVTFNDKPQNTLWLEDIQYDPCMMANHLKWNEYINFDPPLAGYRVYASENGGPYELLMTVPVSQRSYTHTLLQSNTLYSYYVRAFSQDYQTTSTSCVKERMTYDSPRPEYMYIRYVTVVENRQVNFLLYTDTSAHIDHYRVMRGQSPEGPFEQVGHIYDEGRDSVFFIDATADVKGTSYYYQLEVIDSCGNLSVPANRVRTIFLSVEALENYENVLTWNAYEFWSGGVEGYRIYRRVNDSPSLELLQEVDSSVLTFTDNVAGLTGGAGRISYLVEAFEGSGNTMGFRESSFSNEALAELPPRIFVPNAIVPNGINNYLKPVLVFIGSDGYAFYIYNRWGQEIFSTSDPEQGWDGTFNGKFVEGGVYVYLIKYRNAKGQPRVQKGNIAVVY